MIYWIGGVYLATQGVGRPRRAHAVGRDLDRSGARVRPGDPVSLARRRAWFEAWILSRRDFARILTGFMVLRAWHVLKVVLRPETASVSAPWGGEITFRAGAIVFLLVTVAALVLVGRAAWAREAA